MGGVAEGAKDGAEEENHQVLPLRKLLPRLVPRLGVGVSDGTLAVLAAVVGPNPNPPVNVD